MHLEIPKPFCTGELGDYLTQLVSVLQLLADQVANLQSKEENALGK